MKKKVFCIILISASLVIVVFTNGKITITTEISGDGDFLVLKDDNSGDLKTSFGVINIDKAPAIINAIYIFSAITGFFSVVFFLLYFKKPLTRIISIRGPPKLNLLNFGNNI